MIMHRRTRALYRLWATSAALSVAALVAAAVDPGGAARLVACGPLLIGWGP